MKRYLLLLALATSCLWAKSSIITTHGTDCSVATNCLVASLVQDQGGATLVLSGTWTGTIQFEATGDGGATWASVNVLPLNSTTAVTSTTANGTWQVNIAGFTGLRMRSSASMTGSATATITPSAASARSNGGGGGGGGGSPGGSDTQGQFNNNGSFAGSPGLIFSDSTKALLSFNVTSPYMTGSNGIWGKVTTSEGQSVSGDFNFQEQPGTQGGACPTGGTGVVNTANSGGNTNVTWVSGTVFPTAAQGTGSTSWVGLWITVNSTLGQVVSVSDNHHLVMTGNLGTNSGVAYSAGVGWTDAFDHVMPFAWNGNGNGTAENVNYQYTWGRTYEFNWCSGGGDATVEGYDQITLPDGVGGSFIYRPYFTDVLKTANGAGRHVGWTDMFLSADAFTLGSITNLGAHTITNYFSAGPTSFNVSPAAVFGSSITENNSGNSVAGITLGTESGVGGGTTTGNPTIHAGGNTLTDGGSSALNGLVLNAGSYASFECNGSNCELLGKNAVKHIGNSGGFYSNSGSGLGGDFLEHNGTQPGFGMGVNYTDDSNLSTCALSTNGSQFTTAAFFLCFNTGTPNTDSLSSLTFGGQGGVALNMRGGGTQGLEINSSGNVLYGSGATAGVTVSGILCTASFATVQGGVTACTATSDPRLKDYEPLPYGLDAIMHIQPIKFRWNELGRKYNANDTTEHLGFNAQNIQQVMPEAVGTETHDGTDYLSLPHGTDGIVAALVKAVQEQQAQIEQLKAAVAQLKAAR